MKIRKLKIKNYKIFKDIEFDFTDKNEKILDTIVFAGINGTGKTTLLQLIAKILIGEKLFRLFDFVSLEVEFTNKETHIYSKFIENHKYGKDFFAEQGFLTNNILNVVFNSEIQHNSISFLQEFIRKSKISFKIAYFHNNIFPKQTNNNKKNTQKILNYIDYENFEHDLEVYFQEVIHDYLEKNRKLSFDVVTKKRIAEINSYLNKLNVDTKIHDIKGKKIIFENFFGEKLNINDLSDGEKQIYLRAIFLNSLNLSEGLLFVDEPELSLHPTWQSTVTNLYKNAGENNQIFIATHSPHIISSTNPDNLFSLFVNKETKQIEVINVGKSGKYTKGVEPNRILKYIMGTPLRDYQIQQKIDYVARNLSKEFNNKKMKNLISELVETIGQEDPFIIRLTNQLLILNRKK